MGSFPFLCYRFGVSNIHYNESESLLIWGDCIAEWISTLGSGLFFMMHVFPVSPRKKRKRVSTCLSLCRTVDPICQDLWSLDLLRLHWTTKASLLQPSSQSPMRPCTLMWAATCTPAAWPPSPNTPNQGNLKKKESLLKSACVWWSNCFSFDQHSSSVASLGRGGG